VGEVSLAAQQMPRNTETPQYPSAIMGTTPGIATAQAPMGAPTGPDLDVMSLNNVVSQLANQLFAAPMGDEPPVQPGGMPGAAPAMPFAQDFPTWSFPLQDAHVEEPSTQARVTEPTFGADSFDIGGVPNVGPRVFEPNAIKSEFPILSEPVRGKRLVWLDNAATTQKPKAVIDRLSFFYEHENSNIHRAAHTLAAKATDAYESARETVRRFINAPSKNEIVFVRGTTEGINLISQSWGRRNVREGDEILITHLEHHANIVPWQMLCSEKGAKLKVAPVDSKGQVILEEYEKLLSPRTKLVSFTQVSNALGTITPAAEMIDLAHRQGALVLLDGAQSVSHMPVDVQALGADFFVFSGHKVFAPTGIGVVYGREELLNSMPPWQGGGNMIQDVTFERTVYHAAPARFEAGTGNIADAVGLGAALDWLTRVGIHNVERYEHELLEYGTRMLATVPGLTMIGTAPNKAGVLSFILAGQKTEEVGGMLDQEGIAVRSGHHCAQPILRRFGVEATVRASLAPYNTYEDIDVLCRALHKLQAGRR
jgi:cysteine desulfurase/selenocysteine lyase